MGAGSCNSSGFSGTCRACDSLAPDKLYGLLCLSPAPADPVPAFMYRFSAILLAAFMTATAAAASRTRCESGRGASSIHGSWFTSPALAPSPTRKASAPPAISAAAKGSGAGRARAWCRRAGACFGRFWQRWRRRWRWWRRHWFHALHRWHGMHGGLHVLRLQRLHGYWRRWWELLLAGQWRMRRRRHGCGLPKHPWYWHRYCPFARTIGGGGGGSGGCRGFGLHAGGGGFLHGGGGGLTCAETGTVSGGRAFGIRTRAGALVTVGGFALPVVSGAAVSAFASMLPFSSSSSSTSSSGSRSASARPSPSLHSWLASCPPSPFPSSGQLASACSFKSKSSSS